MHCICTSTIGVLVNDTKTNAFSPGGGICQGDSISPYIFILCVDLLSRLINHQVDIMLWDPIKGNYKSPSFSHILFVDDITLMGKANHKIGHCMKSCMNLFCQKSGLSINHLKSKIIFSKNCPLFTTSYFTNLFGMKLSREFGNYFGFSILNNKPKPRDFQFVIDRIRTRSSHWKSSFLNILLNCPPLLEIRLPRPLYLIIS